MSRQFQHLLSPIQIGSQILKSRMIAPQALPHYLQGSEPYPSEAIIHHVSNIARNGAAIVAFGAWDDTDQRKAGGTASHFPMFDYSDPSNETYVCKLVDCIHFYDSLASIYLMPLEMPNFQPKPSMDKPFPMWFSPVEKVSEITQTMMQDMIDLAVKKALYFQQLGFDMISLQMSYREFMHIGLSKFFSPLTNDRTDEYGGDAVGRGKLALDMCRAIKAACGKDFLIDLWLAGEEEPGGITAEDTVSFAKAAEGIVDILQIRGGNINPVHPTGFNSCESEPVTLHVAKKVKESGAKLVVAAAGGYGNPRYNERFIAEGMLDMVAIGRQFICDSNYGKKIYEDRPEDIVPCQRCAKCHVPYEKGPWIFVCSGNPTMGIADRLDKMVSPAVCPKKVAVVGGGIAGMEATLEASRRGHRVTLYEKSAQLGGQLLHADYPEFKWPLRNFKDYMIRQVLKANIPLKLGTEATPAVIAAEGYDAVIVAIGAEPKNLSIPGADSKKVVMPIAVYGHEEELGKNIVVVGGGEIGAETGLYLAECGHHVTLLTRQDRVAPDATCTHYREMFEERWLREKNFHFLTNVQIESVTDTGVIYRDKAGALCELPADNVVISGGRAADTEFALSFYGSANDFFLVGDCKTPGNVQKCMRMAYAAATRL